MIFTLALSSMSFFRRPLFSLLVLLLPAATAASSADVCPPWLKNERAQLPPCPEGGLIPETYPVGAVVVSDNAFNFADADKRDGEFTADVVEKVLTAAGPSHPLLILAVSDSTLKTVQSRIDKMPVSRELKEQYKKSIVRTPTAYTWQQDYFQPTLDPKTGGTALRRVQGYDELRGSSFQQIADAGLPCGFAKGPDLVMDELRNGHMGGNIETLPAGICLLGEDSLRAQGRWEKYADQVCRRGAENRIRVPTSWLEVGHTDEIMKVVRNKTAPAPCDFSVVLASPQKALELLRQNPKDKFMDFFGARGGSPQEIARRRSREHWGLFSLCEEVQKAQGSSSAPDRSTPNKGGAEGVRGFFDWKQLFVVKAWAEIAIVPSAPKEEVSARPEDCANMTNEDVLRVFSGSHPLQIYNNLVQAQMDSLKNEVTRKLKAKLPQCSIDFIEAPDLFEGGSPVENAKGGYTLPEGMGASLLPNPTNAISVNDSVIAPDPSNAAFRKYMESEYKKRGLRAQFVDTFDYAHVGGGNLHCATNTIHVCQPRGRK